MSNSNVHHNALRASSLSSNTSTAIRQDVFQPPVGPKKIVSKCSKQSGTEAHRHTHLDDTPTSTTHPPRRHTYLDNTPTSTTHLPRLYHCRHRASSPSRPRRGDACYQCQTALWWYRLKSNNDHSAGAVIIACNCETFIVSYSYVVCPGLSLERLPLSPSLSFSITPSLSLSYTRTRALDGAVWKIDLWELQLPPG